MVVALNMMDIVKASGMTIDVAKLEEGLGVKVVDISASNKQGIDKVLHALENPEAPKVKSFFEDKATTAIHNVAVNLEEGLSEGARTFIATGLLQNDEIYLDQYKAKQSVLSEVARGQSEIEQEYNTDAQAYFPKRRYEVIDAIIAKAKNQKTSKSSVITAAIDKIVLNNFLALPIFLCVVGLVYFGAMYFTSYLELIPVAGEEETEFVTITDWVNDNLFGGYVSDAVGALCESSNAPAWLSSLAVDGVVGGVGAVLGFLPQIAFLFLFLSFLAQNDPF